MTPHKGLPVIEDKSNEFSKLLTLGKQTNNRCVPNGIANGVDEEDGKDVSVIGIVFVIIKVGQGEHANDHDQHSPNNHLYVGQEARNLSHA